MTKLVAGERTDGPTKEVDLSVPQGVASYRPHLDGLRAIAVYLVVAFHVGSDQLSGGFVGVDVFFVLSGYLVTSVLLRDMAKHGVIRARTFYARRVRRLLPAAVVTVVVTSAVFAGVASPLDLPQTLDAARASLLYVANWFFIAESSDYFAADVSNNPFIHFWSLAIEEQFYLLWPLLLGSLTLLTRRFGARRWSAVRLVIAALAVASLARAVSLVDVDLDRAYYGTDTRAYQLLAGALVALTPSLTSVVAARRRLGRLLSTVPLLGVGVLASSVIGLNPVNRGALVTVLVATTLVGLEASSGGLIRGFLVTAPMVLLGRISYGTYLWHWPFIVIVGLVVEIDPVPFFLLTALVSTGIAALSFDMLERPIRESRRLGRHRAGVIAAGLGCSVIAAVFVVPVFLDSDGDRASVASAAVVAEGAIPSDLDFVAIFEDRPAPPSCSIEVIDRCTVVAGEGQHILLVGDSHAGMFLPTFTALAEERGYRLSIAAKNTCPWQAGLTYRGEVQACRDAKADLAEVVDLLDPDVVVFAERTLDSPNNPVLVLTDDGPFAPDEPGYLDAVRATTAAAVAQHREAGRRVVIIEPIPITSNDDDPLRCLADAAEFDDCVYFAAKGPFPSEQVFRELARADPGVFSIDLDELVCPNLPICEPVVGGVVVKHDTNHLTATYAATLSDEVTTMLVEAGAID